MTTIDDAMLHGEAVADADDSAEGRDCNRDCVVMESEGTVDAASAKYVEGDDVMNSIAEGYF